MGGRPEAGSHTARDAAWHDVGPLVGVRVRRSDSVHRLQAATEGRGVPSCHTEADPTATPTIDGGRLWRLRPNLVDEAARYRGATQSRLNPKLGPLRQERGTSSLKRLPYRITIAFEFDSCPSLTVVHRRQPHWCRASIRERRCSSRAPAVTPRGRLEGDGALKVAPLRGTYRAEPGWTAGCVERRADDGEQ